MALRCGRRATRPDVPFVDMYRRDKMVPVRDTGKRFPAHSQFSFNTLVRDVAASGGMRQGWRRENTLWNSCTLRRAREST